MSEIKYDYTMGGGYADTLATLPDGRRVVINTQYASVDACMGSTTDGIDKAALVADARINGKFGRRPDPVESADARAARERGLAEYEEHRAMMARVMRD